MIETQTSKEERMLRENPRLKEACDAVGAKAGHGPCCMPLDILRIIEAVDAYDRQIDEAGPRASASKAVQESYDAARVDTSGFR